MPTRGTAANRRPTDAGPTLTAWGGSEIGQRLSIGLLTVVCHLHELFPKLTIGSRNERGRSLPRESNAPLAV